MVATFDGGAGNDTLIGGNARDVLDGGPGNDDIADRPGGSEIHTGPGRNIVRSDGGDDQIYVGSGHNKITAGLGKTTFFLEYGGIAEFEHWEDGYTLDLSKWPQVPLIVAVDDNYTDITLGVSVVRIYGKHQEKNLKAQIKR